MWACEKKHHFTGETCFASEHGRHAMQYVMHALAIEVRAKGLKRRGGRNNVGKRPCSLVMVRACGVRPLGAIFTSLPLHCFKTKFEVVPRLMRIIIENGPTSMKSMKGRTSPLGLDRKERQTNRFYHYSSRHDRGGRADTGRTGLGKKGRTRNNLR